MLFSSNCSPFVAGIGFNVLVGWTASADKRLRRIKVYSKHCEFSVTGGPESIQDAMKTTKPCCGLLDRPTELT